MNLYGFVENDAIAMHDLLGASSCKVLIWIGHAGDVKKEMPAYNNDKCIKHVIFACKVCMWSEWKDGTLNEDIVSEGQPNIPVNVAGNSALGQTELKRDWYYDPSSPDGLDYLPGYEEGMRYQDYTRKLFGDVDRAAQKEATAMTLDSDLMKECCCTSVDIELKKVDGWKNIVGPAGDRIRQMGQAGPVSFPVF